MKRAAEKEPHRLCRPCGEWYLQKCVPVDDIKDYNILNNHFLLAYS